MAFKAAIKRDAKLRLALCGPAGSGKTFTLLKLATALVGDGKIAFIDTEHGSASKYAHTDKCGAEGKCADPTHFTFDVDEPSSFDPRKLMDAIHLAVKDGYKAVCIDSLSHYWMGPDGELELVDAAAARSSSRNSFAAWKTVTPIHNALVDLLIAAPLHILVSMRTKTEWVTEKDDRGKTVPRKVGLAPIMRDGIEFEFDVCGDMDQDNTLTVTKSRCSALQGKAINRPGAQMADTLIEWLAGAPSLPIGELPKAPVQQPTQKEVADRKIAEMTAPKAAAKPEAAPKATRPTTKDFGFLEKCRDLKQAFGEDLYYLGLRKLGFEKSNQAVTPDDQKKVLAKLGAALKIVNAASHGELLPSVNEEIFKLLPGISVAAVMTEYRNKLQSVFGDEVGLDEYERIRARCGTQWEFVKELQLAYETEAQKQAQPA